MHKTSDIGVWKYPEQMAMWDCSIIEWVCRLGARLSAECWYKRVWSIQRGVVKGNGLICFLFGQITLWFPSQLSLYCLVQSISHSICSQQGQNYSSKLQTICSITVSHMGYKIKYIRMRYSFRGDISLYHIFYWYFMLQLPFFKTGTWILDL